MISLAIFSILLVILLSAFSQSLQTWNVSEGYIESQQNARVALDWMSMELHEAIFAQDQASAVINPSVYISTTNNVMTFTKSASQDYYDHDFSVITVSYTLSNGNLIRTVNSTSTFTVASNIDRFVVSHILRDPSLAFNTTDSNNNVYDPTYFSISVYAMTTADINSRSTTNSIQRYFLTSNVKLRNNP